MSEQDKDPKGSKEPAEAAATPAPAPARFPIDRSLLLLVGVVVGALVAGGALGSLLLAPRVIHARQAAAALQLADPHHKGDAKAKKEHKKDKKGESGKTPVYKLDNIIVNPADSEGQRFLMCTVAIESDDPKALDVLREHEVELRDRVVTLLSKQPMSRLIAQAARDSIRGDLLTVVQPVLGPDGHDTELRIYLPQFVVQ